jgi:hypothetical protein
MPTLEVAPRPTPEERHDAVVAVDVDDQLATHASMIEDWATPRQSWEVLLRQGTDFDRPNNVEARVTFAAGEQTSSLSFRLDQLDAAQDTGEQLLLRFEERDGIAKVAYLSENGLDVELFHILTFT